MKKFQLNNNDQIAANWLSENGDKIENPSDASLNTGDSTIGFFDEQTNQIGVITTQGDLQSIMDGDTPRFDLYAVKQDDLEQQGQLVDADGDWAK